MALGTNSNQCKQGIQRGMKQSLYTNALMTENRALYARGGYVEYEQRVVQERDTVFMRKRL